MTKIYSKVEPDKLLHVVVKFTDIEPGRVDIIPEDNFIQCSMLNMKKDQTFRPHKHITKERTYAEQIAQESWCIVRGSVRATFYDLDDSVLAEPVLEAGDAKLLHFMAVITIPFLKRIH